MIDIEQEGYNLSSELFSFKDMRRGVIEHGKTCYIKGYKKHADLFSNFLLKNGYFSEEELDKILGEFNESLQKSYKINREDIEKFLPEITCGFEKENWYLTKAQESIINSYNMLTEDCPMLLIKKPRQKGVTSVLKTIAYLNALNNKDVWYLGYGPCYKPLKDCKNLRYREIHSFSDISDKECCGKRYDLIIVDEMTAFEHPWTKIDKLMRTLKEGGRIIVVGTIANEKKYDGLKTISRYNKNVNEFFNTESKDKIWIGLHKITLIINDDV